MAYPSTVQVIERANDTRQFYLICPAPLARAMELEKGEIIDWVVEDKYTLVIKRAQPSKSTRRREVQHAR
jgi:bifunctional DNA-binding transcriptional regulator/antitoxin component of YhaV-PrlF toxin-antitoxin module